MALNHMLRLTFGGGMKLWVNNLCKIVNNIKNQLTVRSMACKAEDVAPTLTLENLNPGIKVMEYAVRGPLVIRAAEIIKELEEGKNKPFDKVIETNIGDCHAMGQKPITFIRQIIGLISYPSFFDHPNIPEDCKKRANVILENCKGHSVGSYTNSVGIEIIRKHVAQYIECRDDGIPSDFNNIFLANGASTAIRNMLRLFRCRINNKIPGIMIPIPQYPLYSATIAELSMGQIGYYLDESNNWGLDVNGMQRVINESKDLYVPRVLVVINPGNPTGQVLTRKNIEEMIKFAYNEKLFIFADEVYQFNVYGKGSKFYSFKKVMMEMGPPFNKMELASFMSCSKGFMGECGIRGGYAEIINMCPDVKSMLFKALSAQLCPTVIGQAVIDCIVNSPTPREPSYELFNEEKCHILIELETRAKLIVEAFNSFEGFSCNPVQGAIYAFPQIVLPPKAIEAAKKQGNEPDAFYASQLLEQTGVCVVPGSGFGQCPGTYHFRTTLLPQMDVLKNMLKVFQKFHAKFMDEYK